MSSGLYNTHKIDFDTTLDLTRLKPYGDTTLTDCTFKEETLDLSSLENGETVTLINCTYDGVAGINAELTRNGELVVTRGYEQVKISSQSKLILNK